jgi:hypothetical protein
MTLALRVKSAKVPAKRRQAIRFRVPKGVKESLRKGIDDLVVPFIKHVDAQRGIRGGEKIKFR